MPRRRRLTLLAAILTASLYLLWIRPHEAGVVGPPGSRISQGKGQTPLSPLMPPNSTVDLLSPNGDLEPPVYPPGIGAPPEHGYNMTLVLPRLKSESIAWAEKLLPDMPLAAYVVDDRTAPLHPPKNKGHEAMVYLTWIIDNYDDLPDVALFMHAHRFTWHNNVLLGQDAVQMVRWLNPKRVVREGYMNLRCHWDPGCPEWLFPEAGEDMLKEEQGVVKKAWRELFPSAPVPSVLAQSCCAQFAVSREAIRRTPKERYVWYRDWLLRTELRDHISGRIFEYAWQYVFSGKHVYCPEMHVCYCDGYGLCFGGKEPFNAFWETRYEMRKLEKELQRWVEMGEAREAARKEGRQKELEQLDVPEPGRDRMLKEAIDVYKEQLDKVRVDAFLRGRYPRVRAEEAGRKWKDGDGY